MARHAYLIMAHNNFYNLERLLKLLDYAENDIYLHIDKKKNDYDLQSLNKIVKNAGIKIFREYKTNWGGFSLVKCEMFLLEQAFQSGKYNYYHLLSGADLPVKKHEEIMRFFDTNQGYEFVQFSDCKFRKNIKEYSRRITLYHFLQEYRRISDNIIITKMLRYIAKVLLGIQVILRINRMKNNPFELKYGSQWFSITEESVDLLLKRKDTIYDMFHFTMCPDEFVIQTMLYNSDRKEYLYQYKELDREEGNVRGIHWPVAENSSHPQTWTIKDFDYLMNSEFIFARKFEETEDRDIIDKLFYSLKDE